MRGFGSIFLIALLAIGCGRTTSPKQATLPDRYYVAEAALHYMCDLHSASANERTNGICYNIDGGEFTQQLLASFSGYKPTVTATTNFEVLKETGGILDKATGKGLKLWKVEVREIHGDSATAYVSWHSSGLAAGGNTIQLKRKDNKWVVVSEKTIWIA